MRLDIDVTPGANGAVVLRADGSIDLDSKGALRTAGEAALEGPGVTTLIVDLSGVSFMDSTGIGTLITLSSRADEQGIGFAIRDPSPRVHRVLQMTGLAEQWPIVSDDA